MKQIYNNSARPQKNNTCEDCNKLKIILNEYNKETCICHQYPAMDSDSPGYMVRCIQYDDQPTLDWLNYIYIDDNKKY